MPAAAAPASDLERRKLLRLRLRADLVIDPQKYEGKTFYVLKDPVSLRYYRLKENEHFLLQFLDGKRTLEEAQKAYEKQYRPERLRLEDLEAFAQQLLNAGLAHNDSPRAGQQLFEQRKKRKRRELLQTLTNILYIKIPVIDPDRLLRRMLHYLSFIFSVLFNLLAISLMIAAIMLVTTHFDTFRSKLPDYHEFFSFKTVVYLWCALGVVKVIHEFGHGLSCKHFGGEVHEMGFLLLCLSPALYCNVSDSWTLPNKWHRIIISFAGIYVELIIAALSTFVWWNTPSQPFINNMALSLMVVCSVSTVVFNANPLMRYDGYYVLADWLEIPNLREKSNRFLMNLVLDKCLGIEVQPEGYMALGRRILFVSYAVISYIYRWVVTFAILYFMYSFLRPYKLEVISSLLTLGAIASMTGWPLYNLGKNLYRRGRLPDMKKGRVLVTTAVVAAVVLFVFFVPVPINRIRSTGLVQYHPETSAKVFLIYQGGGLLEQLKVRDGDLVQEGDELALFSNRELDSKLSSAQTDMDNLQKKKEILDRQLKRTNDPQERSRILLDISHTLTEYEQAGTQVKTFLTIKAKYLILRAPRPGVINGCPRVEDIGKFFEPDPKQPFCTLGEPGQLRICLPVVTSEFNQLKEDVERLSPAALAAHRFLQRRVKVSFNQTRLTDVLNNLEGQVKGSHLWLDPSSLSPASAEKVTEESVTFQASQRKLAAVLDEVLGRLGLGYVVISDAGQPHDGWIKIRPGRERGMPEGPRKLVSREVYIRIQGRDSTVWNGKLLPLPESEAKEIPLALSSKAGGPVAVKANATKEQTLVPQTQHYLVYVDILNPDAAITAGTMAQVKIYCQPETCAHWVWRKINDLFDLGLM